jgi:hypothetical protein
MADTEDLKSSGAKAPCGFESRPRHHISATATWFFSNLERIPCQVPQHQFFGSDFGFTLAVLENRTSIGRFKRPVIR